MKFAFIFILCCLQGVIVTSQSQDSLIARKYIDSLQLSIQTGSIDSACYYYQNALHYIKKTDNLSFFRQAYRSITNSLVAVDDSLLLQCTFLTSGEESLWRLPKNNNELKEVINHLRWVGYCYGYYLGDISKRISLLLKVETLYLESNQELNINLADVYNRLGNNYNSLGEQKKAITYFDKAYKIASLEGRVYETASILNNTGMVYRNLSMFVNAKNKYIQGLELNPQDFSLRSHLLGNLASTYCELGLVDSCFMINKKFENENNLNKAIYPNIYLSNIPYILKNYANYYSKIGDQEKAKSFYLDFMIDNNLYSRERALGYFYLGQLYSNENIHDRAINYFDSSYYVFYPDIHPDSFSIKKNLDINSGNIHVLIRHAKSKAIYSEGKSNYLERSLFEIEKAIKIDSVLLFKTLEFEESRLNALRKRRTYIDHAIKVCFELWQKYKDDQYKIKALEYSELSRANLLYIERSRLFDINPDSKEAKYINSLKDSLSILRDKIRLADSQDITDIEWEQKNIHEELNKRYLGTTDNTNAISITEKLKGLPHNQAIIEYYHSPKDSSLTSFVLTHDGTKIFRRKLHIDLNESVAGLFNYLDDYSKNSNDTSFTAYIKQAHQLYNSLLSEEHSYLIEQNINSIKISADGPLNNLAFDMLLTDQSDSINIFSSLPFVLKELTTSRIHSINFYLDFQHKQQNKSNATGFVSFVPDYSVSYSSNPTRGSTEIFESLPGAKEESMKAHEIFSGESYSGNDAIKSNFKEYAPKYSNILLAMHALLDTTDSNFSSLVFQELDTGIDRKLHSHELSTLKFDADLLVLSTCNSGIGKFYAGEGAMSLSRRFAQQGVRSTVMGLWSLSDQQTAEIITAFYTYLESGEEKDKALQLAKMDYIKNNPHQASPLFWAGLSISGNMEPIASDCFPLWPWYLFFSILIIGFFYLFSKKYFPRR